jgi:hypothetical protein
MSETSKLTLQVHLCSEVFHVIPTAYSAPKVMKIAITLDKGLSQFLGVDSNKIGII